VRAIELQFYGDRSGQFEDPEGYKWTLAQHVEDVPPEEMKKRMAARWAVADAPARPTFSSNGSMALVQRGIETTSSYLGGHREASAWGLARSRIFVVPGEQVAGEQ